MALTTPAHEELTARGPRFAIPHGIVVPAGGGRVTFRWSISRPAQSSRSIAAIVCLAALCHAPAARAQLPITWLSGVTLPNGGEIVSTAGGRLLVTNSGTVGGVVHQALSYTLSASGSLTPAATADLSTVFTTGTAIASISSVLADGRGFGVAAVIPVASGSTNFGRVAFFNTATGSILKTLDVGYHPDSVSITPDGTKILVANEGEVVSTEASFARPGSVSVIDISGVTSGNYTTTLAGLSAANVATYDFSAGNLAAGVTLTGLRNNRSQSPGQFATTATDIEPEYIAATNAKAYVTLQENNAVAVLDFTTGKYEAIHGLGSITKLIDASDREVSSSQGAIGINDSIRGLPMPDTMVRFSVGGTGYLITANEGDAHPNDNDTMRVSQEGTSGRPAIDATVKTTLNALYGGNFKADAALGRLNILRDQGDTDADGDIDVPTALGTRSFSIWNAETGALAFDSGSLIEQWVAANEPTMFNVNKTTTSFDGRSDDKGPEPEAVAFATMFGRDYVFVGAERQNGIFQFDITNFLTDPDSVSIVGYFNAFTSTGFTGGPYVSSESMQFLDAADLGNPTGQHLLIVGFEGEGASIAGSVGVFAVVPEPGTWAMLAGAGLFAALRLGRRRTAAARKS
jgi:hypothetical protein